MSPSHTPEISRLDRVTGALLGLAVGDALGAPLRGMKAGRVAQVYGRVDDYVDAGAAYASKPGRWTPKGLHTSLTQMALALGDSLLLGAEQPTGFRENLIGLARRGESAFGCLRGLSAPMRAALRALLEDAAIAPPADASGCDPSVAAILAPLGLFPSLHGDEDAVDRTAALAETLTADFRAVAASAVAAEAVRRAVGGEWDAADCGAEAARALADWARDWESALAERRPALAGSRAPETRHAASELLSAVPGLLRERNEDLAYRSIAAEATRHEPTTASDDPQAPFAPANVAWAVYLALRERRFDSAIADALAGGRETSAVGALAGAILGGRLGWRSIPGPWRDGLLARRLVEGRAEAYAEANPSILYEEDLAEAEAEWTRLETEGRRARFEALAATEARREERRGARKKSRKPPAPVLPASTYARANPAVGPAVDPEQARKEKALRGRKRIEWKEGRRDKTRRR